MADTLPICCLLLQYGVSVVVTQNSFDMGNFFAILAQQLQVWCNSSSLDLMCYLLFGSTGDEHTGVLCRVLVVTIESANKLLANRS